MTTQPFASRLLRLLPLAALLIASFSAVRAQDTVTLMLASYAVPREAYEAIIPLFKDKWLAEHNQTVVFQESYQASGAQSRAVEGGFEADVVALSLEPDVTRLVKAGLVSEDWKTDNPYGGIVTESLAVLVTREGNPLGITDWADLVKDNVQVITPDPATSGGAQWNLLAAIGAAKRGAIAGYEGEAGIETYLRDLIPHLEVLDKDGRESFLTFARGVGDVAITYENEVFTAEAAGEVYTIVYPHSTILIENPVAVVDTYVDKHGTRAVAEAFVDFLWSPEAQSIFAQKGYRPVNAAVRAQVGLPAVSVVEAAATAEAGATVEPAATAEAAAATLEGVPTFGAVTDLFSIQEFGGWSEARATYFGDAGLFTTLLSDVKSR